MVILWWFNGDFMVIQWTLMVIYGDLMVIEWDVMGKKASGKHTKSDGKWP